MCVRFVVLKCVESELLVVFYFSFSVFLFFPLAKFQLMPSVITEVSEESVKFYMMFSYLRDLLESICILHYIVHIEGTSWEKKRKKDYKPLIL